MGSKWGRTTDRRPPPSNRNGSTPDAIPGARDARHHRRLVEHFDDPTLNGLIDMAQRQNLDLQTAGTRIQQAVRSAMWRPAICSRSRNRPFPRMLTPNCREAFPSRSSDTLNLFGTG